MSSNNGFRILQTEQERRKAQRTHFSILTIHDPHRQMTLLRALVVVVTYSEKQRAILMANAGIVRNRLKIKSDIDNAKAFLAVQKGNIPVFSNK